MKIKKFDDFLNEASKLIGQDIEVMFDSDDFITVTQDVYDGIGEFLYQQGIEINDENVELVLLNLQPKEAAAKAISNGEMYVPYESDFEDWNHIKKNFKKSKKTNQSEEDRFNSL